MKGWMTALGAVAVLAVVAAGPAAAQETDYAKSLRAGSTALTTADIQRLLVGNTFYFTQPEWTGYIFVAADGSNASIYLKTPAGRESRDIGKFTTQGNQFCFTWRSRNAQTCYWLVREGSVHRSYRPDGGLQTTMTQIRPGNPERL